MSVYLAKKVPEAINPPAAFVAKRLNGYAPAPIDSLTIMGRAEFPEIAYDLYRTNIDAFVWATMSSKTVFAQATGFGDYTPDVIRLPLLNSPVAFSPANKFTDDQAKLLLNKLGPLAEMKYVGKTLEYTVPSPSDKVLNAVIKIHNPAFGVGRDRLTPTGFKAFKKTIALIEGFLATNYYPAFSSLEAKNPEIVNMELGVTGKYSKQETFYHYTQNLKRGNESLERNNAYAKRHKMEEERKGDEMEIEDQSDDDVDWTDHNAVMRFEDKQLAGAVTYAKPSGRPSSQNFGPSGSVPNLPGITFPYFRGLNIPDYTTIRAVSVNHFFRLFGETYEECKAALKDHKMGCNGLAGTKEGQELTHMMKGVELALATQTRLFLVFEPEYKGFVLLGAKFSVFDGSKWVDPVDPETLKHELSKMDTHKQAVAKIAEILSGISLKDGRTETVEPDEISSSTAIRLLVKERKMEELEDTTEIDKNLRALIWQTPYRQMAPDTFLSFLNALKDPGCAPSDYPFYIPSVRAPLESHLYRLLASFGCEAPSLWNTRGSVISCIPPAYDPKRKADAITAEPVVAPKEFIILPKPVLIAYKEWDTQILKQGAISMNAKERAKDYRAHIVREDGVKNKIWQALQDVVVHFRQFEDGEPAKKKARGDGLPVASAVDALALFDD